MPPSKAPRVSGVGSSAAGTTTGHQASEPEDSPAPVSGKKGVKEGAKGRRAGAAGAGGSGLREAVLSSTIGEGRGGAGLDFSTATPALLHKYRAAHKLPAPSAYTNPLGHAILGMGIGRFSPTVAGRGRGKRRVPREELAQVVRKHVRDAAVSENEAVVQMCYVARFKDKAFRLKFPAGKGK
ncbi:hypothetical protein EJ06DRAFT_560452 [Trichodelitschia bisporula]|uniref:Histone deacetylase complex subunit SAP30 Sin3 binding domain-containing protein n=1 Tax=Trichodelitschia bisporula TaxID=703511 RepID=A0A6G1HIS0_9PEZI|nr:hypothetical protein EJ06DRAFT_560452 [Trichodelitschia bisporula]